MSAMDPEKLLQRTIARFHSRYEVRDAGYETPCWIWTWRLNKAGYGLFGITRMGFRTEAFAHRAAHMLFVGQIPEGFEIDHKCRNRACVRPEHLQLLTHRDNILVGHTFAAVNYSKTHCPQGHEYTPENTYTYRRMRQCRTCRKVRIDEWNKKERQL
jgi:hypothetical protein